MGNNNVKTAEEQIQTLNLYYQWLHDRLQLKRSTQELQDISFAVDTLVHRITAELARLNGALKVKRVVSVGSMQEGTKIREPDEFDYLLVLEHLSEPGAVEIRRGCDNGHGFGHVIIRGRHLQSQWGQCMDGELLKSTCNSYIEYFFHRVFGYDKGIREVFHEALKAAVLSVRRNEKSCQTGTGVMIIKEDVTCHGPAFTVELYWTPACRNGQSLTVNVDLTPAIDLALTDEIVKASDVYDQRFYHVLKTLNRYMAVPCSPEASCVKGLCFRLCFTESEMNLLRSNVHRVWHNAHHFTDYLPLFGASITTHHIICYKVLKYVFEGNVEKPELFQSYALKTLLLKHLCRCNREDNIALCVDELLDDCLQAVTGATFGIPSIFINTHNILQSKIIHAKQSTLIKAIKDLKTSLVKVGNSSDFKKVSITKPHSVIYHYTNFYTHRGLGIYLDSVLKD